MHVLCIRVIIICYVYQNYFAIHLIQKRVIYYQKPSVTSMHSPNPNHCTAKYAKLLVISAGLQSEHLPATEVE